LTRNTHINNKIKIDSAPVDKTNKNNKPKVSAEEYLQNISVEKFVEPIRDFWNTIRKNGGDIIYGVVGFSGGFTSGSARTSLTWMYNNRIAIISEKTKNNSGIDDINYDLYVEDLKKTSSLYDKTIGSNRVEISFDSLNIKDFDILCKATLDLMNRLKSD
jgi:hypothetical protein